MVATPPGRTATESRIDSTFQTILDCLQRHRLIPDLAGWRVEIAPGGSTDRTFSIIDSQGSPRLMVRLARPGLGERLKHEERVLRELAGAPATRSCTPTTIRRIEDDGLPEGQALIHEHVQGTMAPIASVSSPARENLGECLAWVHQHPRPGYTLWPSLEVQHGTRVDLFRDRLATLWRYQSLHGPVAQAASLIEQIERIDLPASAGWRESSFALIHGDLSFGNILWNNDQPALIDWEFSRDGDPAEDLAYLVSEQNLSADLVAEIAEGYVGAGGDPWALARLPVWLPLAALDAALWWADYWLVQGVDPMTAPEVVERLRRLT